MHLTRSQASPWRQPPPSRPNHAESRNLSKEAFPVLANSPPSTEDDDDSGSDEENQGFVHVDTLELNIFRGYADARNGCHERTDMPSSDSALAKIRDLLVASNLKAISCLICLEKVRQSDPIWHCTTGCHAIYHLICIQAWAGEACKVAEERARARLSLEHFPAAVKDVSWHCPKCRIEYSREQIPREALCYCGKVVDPPVDPWLTAHSCGQICGRSLSGGCGHECKLLCHPGACPPCPQFVKTFCFCGGIKDVRRCSHKHFSCGKKCSKELACGLHACEDICHGGACSPCMKSGIHKCRCGRVEEVRVCSDSIFSCKQPCGKPMKCQKHWCKKVCHQGPCGECELQGKQRCPCGKVAYKELPCDSIAPTCGSTCEKPLPCSLHRCQERCHIGECKTVCRIVTLKLCRCGSLRKEVPCHQDLQCERKCQLLRDCRRHPCKRRCCNGDCPPCSEICGRKLRCGNHKCPAPCHRGPCAPCPLAVRISCACGSTAYEVPCGAERGKRPPRCLKPCPIIPRCSHRENSKPHRCHYGACPPCSLTCNEELLCGHTCKEICHGPRPPANPEFSLKQTKKRKDQTGNASLSGTPCPPCAERILMYCLGSHPGGERVMVCSESSLFSCGRLCGNILACGNHRCQKTCHDVAIPRNAGYEAKLPGNMDKIDSCEKCTLTCQKIRTPPCPHPCMQQCHVGTCSPCSAPLKRSCHCGTLSHTFPCSSFNNFIQEERDKRLSCGGPCHRKLPNCSHLCSEICHPGPCKMATNCQKRVSVWCKCQRLKKEWFCSDVQVAFSSLKLQNLRGPIGVGLLSCDKECLKLIEEQRIKEDTERIRQRASIVSEEPPKKVGRRKRHYGSHAMTEKSRFKEITQSIMKWCMVVLLVLLALSILYYGVQGLYSLSDWMNERESKRPRKKPSANFIMH